MAKRMSDAGIAELRNITVPKTRSRAGFTAMFSMGAEGVRRLPQHHRPALGKEWGAARDQPAVGFAA